MLKEDDDSTGSSVINERQNAYSLENFTCVQCSMEMKPLANLLEHVTTYHLCIPLYECPICKSEGELHEIKIHLAEDHGARALEPLCNIDKHANVIQEAFSKCFPVKDEYNLPSTSAAHSNCDHTTESQVEEKCATEPSVLKEEVDEENDLSERSSNTAEEMIVTKEEDSVITEAKKTSKPDENDVPMGGGAQPQHERRRNMSASEKCNLCGKDVFRQHSKHVSIHLGVHIFQCRLCIYGSAKIGAVQSHLYNEHRTDFDKGEKPLDNMLIRKKEFDRMHDKCFPKRRQRLLDEAAKKTKQRLLKRPEVPSTFASRSLHSDYEHTMKTQVEGEYVTEPAAVNENEEHYVNNSNVGEELFYRNDTMIVSKEEDYVIAEAEGTSKPEENDIVMGEGHSTSPRDKCCLCDKDVFKEHLKHVSTHLGVHIFQCRLCIYGSAKKGAVQGHLYNIHRAEFDQGEEPMDNMIIRKEELDRMHDQCFPNRRQRLLDEAAKKMRRLPAKWPNVKRSVPKGRHIWTYTSLIAIAIINSPSELLTLHEICEFIYKHFPQFRRARLGFAKKVKQSLVLNTCFESKKLSNRGSSNLYSVKKEELEERYADVAREVEKWRPNDKMLINDSPEEASCSRQADPQEEQPLAQNATGEEDCYESDGLEAKPRQRKIVDEGNDRCKLCGKFAMVEVTRHVATHLEINLHQCPLCVFGSATRTRVKHHLATTHPSACDKGVEPISNARVHRGEFSMMRKQCFPHLRQFCNPHEGKSQHATHEPRREFEFTAKRHKYDDDSMDHDCEDEQFEEHNRRDLLCSADPHLPSWTDHFIPSDELKDEERTFICKFCKKMIPCVERRTHTMREHRHAMAAAVHESSMSSPR